MNVPLAQRINQVVFRTSSRYRLVLFDRLSEAERKSLENLRLDPNFYGVLRPVEQSGTFKAIDRESALLLYTLGEAGTLPAYVLEGDPTSRRPAQIAALVLDGVLEMEAGGRFVSGPEAQPFISGGPAHLPIEGSLAKLAHEAIRYAEALLLDDIEALAGRLYAYHRLPLTPRWRHRFENAESILDHVGAGADGPHRDRLLAWGQPTPRRDATDWLGWSRRGLVANPDRPTFKLYLSPIPEALEAAVTGLIEIISEVQPTSFKLGGDAAGLLRPDKLVVYFDDFDSLSYAAGRLYRRLEGLTAHGVPFTAEIAGGGLLSWGMDPPENYRLSAWQPVESWRLWVVRRLAAALIGAQNQPTRRQVVAAAPWRFALERLRLAGIDVDRWIPQPTLWDRAAA